VSIIMLTARTLPTERIRGLTSGADDYLAKPFHPEELAARVRTRLHRASQLRSVSPVTRMPGNFDIVRELDLLTSTDDVPFALVHADLDYFKAYNDHYGFLRGDDAIRATARLIESSVAAVAPSMPRFAGHIGGDDFAVIVAPDVVDTLCRTIVDGFDEMVAGLYDAPDRARGSIEVCDRRGNVHRFAFLTISLGVVCSTVRKIRSASEASSIANEMKQLAKSIPGSVWKIDRRRA
jgi:diguanylate cyclase (GGDEF)-like protein